MNYILSLWCLKESWHWDNQGSSWKCNAMRCNNVILPRNSQLFSILKTSSSLNLFRMYVKTPPLLQGRDALESSRQCSCACSHLRRMERSRRLLTNIVITSTKLCYSPFLLNAFLNGCYGCILFSDHVVLFNRTALPSWKPMSERRRHCQPFSEKCNQRGPIAVVPLAEGPAGTILEL